MIGADEAQRRLLALCHPLPPARKILAQCFGGYLAEDLTALRTQPAADLSAMDGYAVHSGGGGGPWRVIGESAAGAGFHGSVTQQTAVRIFTGAPIPPGADRVIIQEDVALSGGHIVLRNKNAAQPHKNIRKAGSDFAAGDMLIPKGSALTAGVIAAAAMAGHRDLLVGGRPKISIIASGNELVPPGEMPDANQIPSSNSIMLHAMLARLPCDIYDHGIARDDLPALIGKIDAAKGSDIIVTIGGASVGDHDLVQAALKQSGAEIDFWRIAIRPGKPMMAGTLGDSIVLGLPGNPGSAFVTAFLFLLPLVRHLAGAAHCLLPLREMPCGHDLRAGGERAEYLRAQINGRTLLAFDHQDSGMTRPLAAADALIIRPANAPAAAAGSPVSYLPIDV